MAGFNSQNFLEWKPVKDIDFTVNQTDGCLITDSQNVFDKMETKALNIGGAERRTDLELLSLNFYFLKLPSRETQ